MACYNREEVADMCGSPNIPRRGALCCMAKKTTRLYLPPHHEQLQICFSHNRFISSNCAPEIYDYNPLLPSSFFLAAESWASPKRSTWSTRSSSTTVSSLRPCLASECRCRCWPWGLVPCWAAKASTSPLFSLDFYSAQTMIFYNL
jgi:hypothetical protein